MGFLIKVTEKETRRLTFRRRHFHDFRPCSQLRVEANGRGGRGAGGAGGGARHPASSGGKERRWLTRATRRRRLGRGEIWSTAHDGRVPRRAASFLIAVFSFPPQLERRRGVRPLARLRRRRDLPRHRARVARRAHGLGHEMGDGSLIDLATRMS